MNYSKAIRIGRSLADMPQRELAKRVSIDPSLISMLENGKRKPSLETLEKIAAALGIPLHLFTLLGAGPDDLRNADSDTVHKLAVKLSELVLSGDDDDAKKRRPSGRKTPSAEHKSTRRYPANPKKKTG